MTTWYLLREKQPRDAAQNMAVDQHLLELVETGVLDAPVLRTYAWTRPTLSLGYHQQWRQTVDLEALARHGIDLVRRWTGGRGVLHDHGEITYSVVAPTKEPFSTRIAHNYRLIGTALARFTHLEASPAVMAETGESAAQVRSKRHLPCFASISDAEIEKSGRKLIGSSQKIGRGAFLQHGSIPMIHRTRVLEEITRTEQDMSGLMASLEEHFAAASVPLPGRKALVDRLIDAFAMIFHTEFRDLEDLGYPDNNEVNRIASSSFTMEAWTFRK
ncbi:MAG: biotin/lipoate A/B protein ligase family protein [Acidobacteriota bacterium]|nr:biotin/lipoate A/B protein ligase family protein [Acidobacteriota bacterium]